MVHNGTVLRRRRDLLRLTAGWVGVPIGWFYSCVSGDLFPPGLCSAWVLGRVQKKKKKKACFKRKGGNKGFFPK